MDIYLNNDKNNCCGCGACVNVCPCDAVSMQSDEYGFAYPVVNEEKCVQCGRCTTVCEKVNKNESSMPLKAFAATHRDRSILMSSSSGGVFSALAEHILDMGGVVCGCIFDDNLNAVHICTEKKDELCKIRKSKYLQSDVGLIYRDIKKCLIDGKHVLFTGTPCQVAALYAVLGKKYKNLTTMDLICHGVPSQLMFDSFIKYLEKQYKTKIVEFDFRSKKYGWQRYTMEFTDSRQRKVNIGKAKEFYVRSFTNGDIIRPSCLSCKYACANRIGDITIGDFWGHERFDLKCDTLNGTSIFTINTEDALKWRDILFENLLCEEIDYRLAAAKNACLNKPTSKGKNRDLYMQAFKENKIEKIVLKYKEENKKLIFREKIKFLIPASIFVFIKKLKSRR